MKFLPSGHALETPLQNFARSASGTSASLLLALTTMAIFFTAGTAVAAKIRAKQNTPRERNKFTGNLACMSAKPF
jgi:hypothetical protein